MNVRPVFVALLFVALAGCGGRQPVKITAAEVFNIDAMTGQTWVFQNAYGDHTYISIEKPPAGFYMGCTVWHYTKDAARAYWALGVPNAELHFVMCPQRDGSWEAKASLVDVGYGGGPWTQDVEPSADGKIPYLIIPARSAEGQKITDDTSYISFGLSGVASWASIEGLTKPTNIAWRTDSYIEDVSTPVYSGPALVSEQWEAFSGPCFPTETVGCAHEKWYFAPHGGLVKVVPMGFDGFFQGVDPLTAMQRIK